MEAEKWKNGFDNHSHVTATQPLTGHPYLQKKTDWNWTVGRWVIFFFLV